MQTATKTRRKPPTEEQAAAAADRRTKMRTLARRIAELTPEAREALAARAGIRSIEGRPLSIFNSCMLVSQLETCTVVGGFQQWRRAGRHVMKGARGLAIWIPVGNGSETPTAAEAGDGEEGGKGRRFVLGTVFDITQTAAEHETVEQAPEAPGVPVFAGEVVDMPRALPMPTKCAECGCKLQAGACPICGEAAQVAA